MVIGDGESAGGGAVQASYGPMGMLAVHMDGQGQALGTITAAAIATCGNPTLDAAMSSFDTQFRGAVSNLAQGSQTEGIVVKAVVSNFHQADS